MTIPLWTKLAGIALVAGTAFAWSAGPSAAQLIPSRIAVADEQTRQVVDVRYHRKHAREHRRWRRDGRRHHRYRHGHRRYHRDHITFGFGYTVPYVVPYVAAPAYTVAPPPVAPTGCGPAVVVRPGDTLARIAAHCGTSVGALLGANPEIYNPHVIHAGQVVRMPWG